MNPATRLATLWQGFTERLDEGLAALPGLSALSPRWRVLTLDEALSQTPEKVPLLVRLHPHEGSFERTLHLPGARPGDVAQALAFNLERWSPFPADQTLAARVPGETPQAGTPGAGGLKISLGLADRTRLEAHAAALRAHGWSGALAFDARPQGAATSYDLLSQRRARAGSLSGGDVLGVFACLGALAGIVGALVLMLSGEETLADQVRNDPATRIDAQLRRSPSLVAALEAVSEALPDDAHLDALVFDQDGITAIGEASDATRLPALIEASGQFSGARIDGAVETSASGGQTFELVASHAGGRRP